jgi:hypothetical protein
MPRWFSDHIGQDGKRFRTSRVASFLSDICPLCLDSGVSAVIFGRQGGRFSTGAEFLGKGGRWFTERIGKERKRLFTRCTPSFLCDVFALSFDSVVSFWGHGRGSTVGTEVLGKIYGWFSDHIRKDGKRLFMRRGADFLCDVSPLSFQSALRLWCWRRRFITATDITEVFNRSGRWFSDRIGKN